MTRALAQNIAWLVPLAGLLLTRPAAGETPAAPARASSAQPNVHVLPQPFLIPGLNRARTVRVYLPPAYERSRRRYPVLYMHDGQNLFDDATAYAGEWAVDETLNTLAHSAGFGLIVVGIDNGGAERMRELNPWDHPDFGAGAGNEYLAFIVEVLKPWIDAHYRTRADRANTAIMGSSMGGLISSYALSRYPQVFSKAGIFSPSYWVGAEVFANPEVHPPAPATRVYFYAGASEGGDEVLEMKRMAALFERVGLPRGNLSINVNPVGRHNEAAWRAEFPHAIRWLFRLPPPPRYSRAATHAP